MREWADSVRDHLAWLAFDVIRLRFARPYDPGAS
jgi:hypothetical protein